MGTELTRGLKETKDGPGSGFEKYSYGWKMSVGRRTNVHISKGNKANQARKCSICKHKIPNESFAFKVQKVGKYEGPIVRVIICSHCLEAMAKISNTKQHDEFIPTLIAKNI